MAKIIGITSGFSITGGDVVNVLYKCFKIYGKPKGNIESFIGRFREECLNMHKFNNLKEMKEIIENYYTNFYNFKMPHTGLK